MVTELAFKTIPEPNCTAFELIWEHHHMTQVITAWQDWAPTAPDALAASLLVSVAADPAEPPQTVVLGTLAGNQRDLRQLLSVLTRAVRAEPASSWRRPSSWLDVRQWLNDRGAGDTHGGDSISKSEYFRKLLPPLAVADLVAELTARRVAGEARELDFSPWSGAYNRVPDDRTSFPHRHEQFLLKHTATVQCGTTTAASPVSDWVTRSWRTVQPWGSGGVYPNFPDPDLGDPGTTYYRHNLGRVEHLRASYSAAGSL